MIPRETNKQNINWRYCDPQGGEYTLRIVEAEERTLGYVVLRKRDTKNKTLEKFNGYIMDSFTLPNCLNVANVLLDDVIENFDKNRVNLIQYFVIKDQSYEKLFTKKGFKNSRTKLTLFYKSWNSKTKINHLINSRKIHIQYVDTDWI